MDRCAKLAVEALDQDQKCTDAWNLISMAHKFSKGDPIAAKAKKLLGSKPGDKYLERELCYTLSKAANDIEYWDRAWTYAEAGAKAIVPKYNPDQLSNAVTAQERFLTAEMFDNAAGNGFVDLSPLFIVGMPRSGTTLVERILEAHPNTHSVGEAHAMSQIVNAASTRHAHVAAKKTLPHEWMAAARPEDFSAIGQSYADAVGGEATQSRMTIDKMPGNLLLCGAIRLALPKAKIIWVRRDPLDTCVSCFLSRFGAGHVYSYRLEWLAKAFLDYDRSGRHYAGLLQDHVLELNYESLVSCPEPEIRRVLKFAGLEWDARCLAPEGIPSTSLTLSSAQVKQPINASSVGRWRRYERRIEPLANYLGIAI